MMKDMAQLSFAPAPERGWRSGGGTTGRVALALAVVVSLLSCGDEPPYEDFYNQVDLLLVGPGAMSNGSLESGLVSAIDGAEMEVLFAAEDFESLEVAQALIRAQSRGVTVKVVGDADRADQAGFVALFDGFRPDENGAVPVQLGDGPLLYNPALIDSVTRSGDMNRMTHNFAVIDFVRVLAISGGLRGSDDEQIGFDVVSEDVAKDFADEFIQMYGGVFATTLDTYNGPLKSDANNRDHYPMLSGDMEIYFGPQERSIKKVIDEVYAAKASVWIVTEEFTNAPLAQALRYKGLSGFDVKVLIDAEGAHADHSRVDTLVQHLGTDRVFIGNDVHVNAVIIDAIRSPIDGRRYRGRAMMLSQPLTSSLSFIPRDSGPDPRTADAFMDSNMWVLNRYPSSELVAEFETLVARVEAIFGRAGNACDTNVCGNCSDGICGGGGQ